MTDISLRHSDTARAIEPARKAESLGYWSGVGQRLRRDPVTLVCITILILMLLATVFAPLLAPYDPLQGAMVRRLKPPGFRGHWLGTDELGRDMLTRLLYGGRLSWFVGITPVVVATLIGGMLGMTAGYVGGKVNMLIMRTTDVFYAFPSVLLAVAISGALGPGIYNAITALTIVFIPPMIRVSESVTTSVRNLEFVDAARATGAGAFRIMRMHVLPNVWPDLRIRNHAGQRFDDPRGRHVLHRARRQTARGRVGLDAQHAPVGDLYATAARDIARRVHFHDQHLLQSHE